MGTSLILATICLSILQVASLDITNNDDITKLLEETMPKVCTKDGHTYQVGEEFQINRLRYKCHSYGVYSIEGCVSSAGTKLSKDESKLENNILTQCLTAGNTLFFRETSCGTDGMISCDKVPKPEGFEKKLRTVVENGFAQEQERSKLLDNPKGWRVVDEGQKKLPGKNGTFIFRTLMFDGIQSRRARRDSQNENVDLSNMKLGHGIGRVIGMEDVGTDKPQMPMALFTQLTTKNSKAHTESGPGKLTSDGVAAPGNVQHAPVSPNMFGVAPPRSDMHGSVTPNTVGVASPRSSLHEGGMMGESAPKSGRVISVQTVTASTNLQAPCSKCMNNGNVVTGITDLKATSPIVSAGVLKPGTVRGHRNSVNWDGKTVKMEDKTLATGTGKFVFGRDATGQSFLKKDD